jgi:hypothetical protein
MDAIYEWRYGQFQAGVYSFRAEVTFTRTFPGASRPMSRTKFSRRAFVLLMALPLLAGGCLSISDPGEGLAVFSVTGGNNQVVLVNTAAALPLSVRAIDERTGGMPGVTVQWTIVSGTGTLSATSTVTGETGEASVNFTAGSETGPVLVRATAQDLRVTFTVTVVSQLPG